MSPALSWRDHMGNLLVTREELKTNREEMNDRSAGQEADLEEPTRTGPITEHLGLSDSEFFSAGRVLNGSEEVNLID